MSTRNAMLVLVAATLVGVAGTLIAGSEPGFLLGFFITIGAVAATLGIRRGAVYLMYPLPAFALFVAAFITGKIHDSSLTSSTTGLGVGGLQWIADIFFPMLIATIAVIVVGGARWVLAHQLVIGQFPADGRAPRPDQNQPDERPGTAPPLGPGPAPRPGPGPAPRSGPGFAPRPGPDVARPDVARPDVARPDVARPDVARPDVARTDIARTDRAPRDQRPDRDAWGDPRQPPADPRARADARDGYPGRPATPGRGPGGQPRERAPRPAGRPPWDDRPRGGDQPRRPGSAGSRDPWDDGR